MNNKIYVDQSGNYLGEYSVNNPSIAVSAVEAESRPDDIRKLYDFNSNEWVLPTEIKKQDLREALITARLNFLDATDFRALRFIDEATPYPDEIKAKRIQARQEINEIEAATTLTALNTFSATFE